MWKELHVACEISVPTQAQTQAWDSRRCMARNPRILQAAQQSASAACQQAWAWKVNIDVLHCHVLSQYCCELLVMNNTWNNTRNNTWNNTWQCYLQLVTTCNNSWQFSTRYWHCHDNRTNWPGSKNQQEANKMKLYYSANCQNYCIVIQVSVR